LSNFEHQAEFPPQVAAAFAELGVDAQTPADEVRRAYLRLIKTRKPEVDRAGFQRARTAWELVRQWQAFTASQRVEDRSDGDSREVDTSKARVSPSSSALVSTSLAAPGASAPSAQIEPSGRPNEPSTWRSFREELERASDAEAARSLLLTLVRGHAHEPGDDARNANRSYEAWLSRHQLELSLSEMNELWFLVRELGRLPSSVPTSFEQEVARGLLSHDLEPAVASVIELATNNAIAFNRLDEALASPCPALHETLVVVARPHALHHGSPGEPSFEASRTSPGFSFRWPFAVLIVLGLLRLIGSHQTSSSTASPAPPRIDSRMPTSHFEPTEGVPSIIPAFDVTGDESVLCHEEPSTCVLLGRIRLELGVRDCTAAQLDLAQLQTTVAFMSPSSKAGRIASRLVPMFSTQVKLCQLSPK
jgi:hypothetical protein